MARPLRIAVLGARTGLGTLRVVRHLGTATLALLHASAAQLARARERLAAEGCAVTCFPVTHNVLTQELLGAFDVVLALSQLHAYDAPTTGPTLASLLLAPRGTLLAVEQDQLSPLGLIAAVLPTRGFAVADPGRRAAGSPLLPAPAWIELLSTHGFGSVACRAFGDEPSILLTAQRECMPAGWDLDEVKATARVQLPPSMIPQSYVALPAMPLTANGKIDRKLLHAILSRQLGAAVRVVHEPPRPGIEQQVADVWRELLRVDRVGRQDEFFALGGDSLLGTRMLHRLRERGIEGARIAPLFTHPRLCDYARTLDASASSGASDARATLVSRPELAFEPFDPTDVQRAYWIGRSGGMALGGVGAHYYSEFEGELDLTRLERAFQRLVERHDMLRAVFDVDGRQRVLESAPPFRIPVNDARAEDVEGCEGALARLREAMSHQVLDPARWPLFDVRAVRYVRDGAERTRLGVSLDNMVLDGDDRVH